MWPRFVPKKNRKMKNFKLVKKKPMCLDIVDRKNIEASIENHLKYFNIHFTFGTLD